MNMITVPKLLITVAAFLSSWLALLQNQYDEILNPENIPYGFYYQNGPSVNNALNWDYPFGSKITMNAMLMWNELNSYYSDGYDFSIFTYDNRDLTYRAGTDNLKTHF